MNFEQSVKRSDHVRQEKKIDELATKKLSLTVAYSA
jgi:hypothetical protein